MQEKSGMASGKPGNGVGKARMEMPLEMAGMPSENLGKDTGNVRMVRHLQQNQKSRGQMLPAAAAA